MSKEQTQAGDTKSRILREAEKLFTEKGVKTTSLADIARSTQISKGTLYYYYTSKEDIICDITDIHLNQMTEELIHWVSSIAATTPKDEMLETVIRRVISEETRGKLHLYLLSEAIAEDNKLRPRIMDKYKEWQEVIQRGIKTANIQSKYDPLVLSQIIIALIDGFSILKLMGVENTVIKEAATIFAQENETNL